MCNSGKCKYERQRGLEVDTYCVIPEGQVCHDEEEIFLKELDEMCAFFSITDEGGYEDAFGAHFERKHFSIKATTGFNLGY